MAEFPEAIDLDCNGVPAHFMTRGERSGEGILLLPSLHGREPYVMRYMQALVEAGYPTLLWDLFAGKGEAHTREDRAARGASLTDAGSIRQLSKLIDFMFAELGFTRVAALGFCLGGRYGLALAARDPRLTGLVAYFPSIETPRLASQEWDVVAEAVNIPCPVHMITPGKDHLTSRDVFQALQRNLEGRDVPTSIQFFPDAEHAFMQVERRHGVANEQARAMSTAATFAFLDAVFGRPRPATLTPPATAREQCWLMSVEDAPVAPALSISMEEIRKQHHEYLDNLKRNGILVGAGASRRAWRAAGNRACYHSREYAR